MRNRKRRNSPMYDVWRRLKRNRLAMVGLLTLMLIIVISIFAPLIIPYPYDAQDFHHRLESPSSEHLLGTDNFGRDILSRIIYGSRYTMVIGFGCISAAAFVGTILGALAAYFPKTDNLIMRIIDIIMGIPTFMLALSIIVALGSNIQNMMIALSITSTPAFARVARAQILTVKEQEFIEAARSIGASDLRILIRHIMPNSMAPLIIQYTLGVVFVILWGASLSFIGLGVEAPTPEWGLMIAAGRTYLRDQWYMSIIPGLAIIVTTYALNLLGDGLRDALDPKLRQ